MPALNFQKRFAPAVKAGFKNQTIRSKRKNPIKEDDTLYLYTGMRTKNCEKLKEVTCKTIFDFKISIDGKCVSIGPFMIREKSELNNEATLDGFVDWAEMVKWFSDTHGLPFEGDLILW